MAVITSDVIQILNGEDAVDFAADQEVLTIAPAITVYSETGEGISSDGYSDSALINYGRVYAAGGSAYGVVLGSLFLGHPSCIGSVINEKDGEIFSQYQAV